MAALITSLVVCVSCFVLQGDAIAAAWNGSAAEDFASGSGTEAKPYLIKSPKQMGFFLNQLNSGKTYEGQYIKLEKDLDMTGGSWVVAEGTVFAGTFLGNNKTLTMDSNFLGTIAAGGTVDWLNLKASTLNGPLLCYTNKGTIQNCRVRGNVDVGDAGGNAALLCENNNGAVVNSCGFGDLEGGTPDGDADCHVGWIGINEGTVENCYAVMTISGTDGDGSTLYMGSVVGRNGGEKTNCYEGGEVLANSADFVEKLNQNGGLPGYIWTVDSSNVNEGYPIIEVYLTAVTHLTDSADPVVVFHSDTLSAELVASETVGVIYYTLDGTDPTTSSTRSVYSQSFTISGDTVVTSVAYKNGIYGLPTRQQVVWLPGSGTADSPYIISTNAQLYAIRVEPDKVYELAQDLDFTNEPGVYQGENWESIPSFSGTLMGSGHSITGLSSVTGGLVDSNSGVIRELRLIDHQLCVSSADDDPGSFGAIANNNSGTITRCYAGTDPDVVKVTDAASGMIGGIVGNNTGTISYCSSSGTIKLSASGGDSAYRLGGIAGYNEGGTVRSCYSDMNLYGAQTNHDHGASVSGIAVGGTVCDSRFDGLCEVNDCFTVSFGVGAGTENGSRVSSCRIYDGGAVFDPGSAAGQIHYAEETDLCTYQDSRESGYPAFDFNSVWMMTADGPMPQGIMDADGRCMAKYAYTEPTCTAVGSAVSYDMLNTDYKKTETLPLSGHTEGEAVKENEVPSTCGKDGSYDEVVYCAVEDCGKELRRETTAIPADGKHSYVDNHCAVCGAEKDTTAYEANIAANALNGNPVRVGETLKVDIGANRAFAAAEMTITYDSDLVSFVSPAESEALYGKVTDDGNGTIKLADYGADKTSADKYVLAFTANTAGDAVFKITEAGFGTGGAVSKDDLTSAAFDTNGVTIEIKSELVHVKFNDDSFYAESTAVEAGSDFEFYPERSAGAYYDYQLPTASYGNGSATVTHIDGGWAIEDISGDVIINSAVRTPKNFGAITYAGTGADAVSNQTTEAVYLDPISFSIPGDQAVDNDTGTNGYAYTVTATIGDTSYTFEKPTTAADGTRTYTIPGADVKGAVTINVAKTTLEANKVIVSIGGNASGDGRFEGTTSAGASIQVNKDGSATLTVDTTSGVNKGYIYEVKRGDTTLELKDGKVTISNITANTTITIDRTLNVEGVTNVVDEGQDAGRNFLALNGTNMWLIQLPNHVQNTTTARYTYKGEEMYWSADHNNYVIAVISEEAPGISADMFKLEEIKEENVYTRTVASNNWDVNQTGTLDANDAQLIWNMYSNMYQGFTDTVTVEKFLLADANHDGILDLEDAAVIIKEIFAPGSNNTEAAA